MGGWGSVTPRAAGVQGAALLYAAQCAKGGWLAKQTPAQRGVGRCARRSARRVGRQGASGKRRAAPRRSPRPGSAGHVLASEGRGCATQAAQTGATCPDGRRRPSDAHGPPSYGGRGRTSTYRATGTGRQALQGWRSHRRSRLRPCKGWRAVQRLARAQPPPWAAVWIEGGAWRRPARHLCGASAASGTGAAPSRAGGKG